MTSIQATRYPTLAKPGSSLNNMKFLLFLPFFLPLVGSTTDKPLPQELQTSFWKAKAFKLTNEIAVLKAQQSLDDAQRVEDGIGKAMSDFCVSQGKQLAQDDNDFSLSCGSVAPAGLDPKNDTVMFHL